MRNDLTKREWRYSYSLKPTNKNMFLKKYLIQLVKRQWGQNLSKFQGVAMLGGVQMNGEQIYSQAIEEITKLEEQIQLSYELPPNYMVG